MIGDMTAIQLHGVTLQSHDIDSLAREFEHGSLVFHNVDTIGKLGKDDEFRMLCAEVDYSVVDGQVLAWLLTLFWGTRVKKASGSDFLREFCVRHADDPSVRVFLLEPVPASPSRPGRGSTPPSDARSSSAALARLPAPRR